MNTEEENMKGAVPNMLQKRVHQGARHDIWTFHA